MTRSQRISLFALGTVCATAFVVYYQLLRTRSLSTDTADIGPLWVDKYDIAGGNVDLPYGLSPVLTTSLRTPDRVLLLVIEPYHKLDYTRDDNNNRFFHDHRILEAYEIVASADSKQLCSRLADLTTNELGSSEWHPTVGVRVISGCPRCIPVIDILIDDYQNTASFLTPDERRFCGLEVGVRELLSEYGIYAKPGEMPNFIKYNK